MASLSVVPEAATRAGENISSSRSLASTGPGRYMERVLSRPWAMVLRSEPMRGS